MPVSPTDAAPLLGDWAIPLETTYGEFVAYVTLHVEEQAVVALLSSALVPEQRATDVSKSGNGIKIRAKMDYDGPLVEKPTAVSLELTLTPARDVLSASFDFNNAKFLVSGTGRRLTP